MRELKDGILVQLCLKRELTKKQTPKGMEYFDTIIKKNQVEFFSNFYIARMPMLENNWVTLQYPRMGNISSKFPGGSMILPLLNNFVFLRPINSLNYCEWFTLAKKSTEISGGNQSLLNLNLSCSINSIFSLVRSYICLSCCISLHPQLHQYPSTLPVFLFSFIIWFRNQDLI